MLPERPHFLLRSRTQAVEILRHLLRGADDVVLVAVVHVAQERRRRGRRLRLLALLREGRGGERRSEQRDREESLHHARASIAPYRGSVRPACLAGPTHYSSQY